MSDYSFTGFDKFERMLTKMIEEEFPAEFETMVIKMAYELQGLVKENTPQKTGHLQDEWKVGKITKRGNEYVVEVYNNVDYAEPVEYGHRTRGGKGFVPGKHMMAISLDAVAQKLPNYMQTWLSEFLETRDF